MHRLLFDRRIPVRYDRRVSVLVSNHKRAHGQFFTVGNPFLFPAFKDWFQAIPVLSTPNPTLLEPFAGTNNIVRLMREAGYDYSWACYDIDPSASSFEGCTIRQQDTLANFPRGFDIVITNPPYFARNSAVRRGLPYPKTRYDDLYKHALDITLSHTPWVAAIIPESFITSGLFHDRLSAVISLTSQMFDDTEHPVCLALFSPAQDLSSTDFELYDQENFLGMYKSLSSVLGPVPFGAVAWRFNDPRGVIGLNGVDNNKQASIFFVPGSSIPSSSIKHSSRANTRISGIPSDIDQAELIECANDLLAQYRARTHDMMMTSFKGMRSDGRYRRRLDFTAARNLLDHAVAQLRDAKSPGSWSI